MREPCVYFIQADESGPIKIGFTADDPLRRLNQLQTGNASTLKLLGSIKGTAVEEKELHAELSEWRLQGEWFEPHPTVLGTIQNALARSATTKQCLHCSFCFRCEHDGPEIMMRGPAEANICEACIAICVQVVEDYRSVHPFPFVENHLQTSGPDHA